MSVKQLSGIVIVYKEKGWTSFDVVAVLRRIFGLRRVGHSGTLDPFAEGVLPICLGRATAAVRYMEPYDKRYTVTVAFGQATETQDPTGAVIGGNTPTAAELARAQCSGWPELRAAVAALPGEHQQVPPMYSAVKIKGEPLYKYARRGEVVERPARSIYIKRADILDIRVESGPAPLRLDLDIECSKGTYIRTIAAELGERLGYGAHAAALIRTACGPFTLEGARTPAQIQVELQRLRAEKQEGFSPSCGDDLILPIESALSIYPVLELDANYSIRLLQGQLIALPMEESSVHADMRYRVRGPQGFLGMAKPKRNSAGDWCIAAERMMANLDDYTT